MIIDFIFIVSLLACGVYLFYFIDTMKTPIHDGLTYLENARDWMYGTPLLEIYRPPLLSWLISGIWFFTDDSWHYVKGLHAIFTLLAIFVFYYTLRKYKGIIFALAVSLLTLVNSQVFFYSTQIITEGISLFFLMLSLHFCKSNNSRYWYLAGISIGLTFASRYSIIVPAMAIFITEFIIRRDFKFFSKVTAGAIPVILGIVIIMFLKTGTFTAGLEKDTNLSIFISPYYILNSINIWGYVVILVPLSFIFRRTYADKFNYTFISWFIIPFLFWSSNTVNFDPRFTIQFTPAAYYLSILTIEYFWNANISKSGVKSYLYNITIINSNFKRKIKYHLAGEW